MPNVEFPDAEAMVVAFLNAHTSVKFGTKVPSTRPARYGRAWRTGGSATNRALEEVQITVTCAAASTVTASEDAREARHALLNDYSAMPLVRGVDEVVGPYYDPDPDTNEDRYTFTVRLRVRGRR